MALANEFQEVLPGLFTWQAFCFQSKVDLTSHALLQNEQLWLIDPIELTSAALQEFESSTPPPAGILLTNGNHERDTKFYQQRYHIPVYADSSAAAEITHPTEPFPDLLTGIEVISLPGAGPGETGFWVAEKRLLILGDILINLGSFSFAPLPVKYATDFKAMQISLQQLTRFDAKWIVFAHGNPVCNGKERLAEFKRS